MYFLGARRSAQNGTSLTGRGNLLAHMAICGIATFGKYCQRFSSTIYWTIVVSPNNWIDHTYVNRRYSIHETCISLAALQA